LQKQFGEVSPKPKVLAEVKFETKKVENRRIKDV